MCTPFSLYFRRIIYNEDKKSLFLQKMRGSWLRGWRNDGQIWAESQLHPTTNRGSSAPFALCGLHLGWTCLSGDRLGFQPQGEATLKSVTSYVLWAKGIVTSSQVCRLQQLDAEPEGAWDVDYQTANSHSHMSQAQRHTITITYISLQYLESPVACVKLGCHCDSCLSWNQASMNSCLLSALSGPNIPYSYHWG